MCTMACACALHVHHVHYTPCALHCVQVLSRIQQSLSVIGEGGANATLNQSDFEAASSAVSDLIVKCARPSAA